MHLNGIRKKRVLIIGSNGMLGQRLVEFFLKRPEFELFCASFEDESFIQNVDYTKIDIGIKSEVKSLLNSFFPDFIINSAAFTNVDKNETDKESAWRINVTSVEYLAKYALALDAHLIHFSTDYIFDGAKGPYKEGDTPNPVSYYGRSKLASENAIKTTFDNYTIFRINVLYGPALYGKLDFVRWVVDKLSKNEPIRIVDDQFNNPSFTEDIAEAVFSSIENNISGIFNIGGKELLNRYEFTKRIADYFDLDKTLITPIKSDELEWLAVRPLNSGLLNHKAESELDYKPHSLEETFGIIKQIALK
ncbi:MAG: dTDP-4-dehydrorhamnose reductase [Melioribacteraceae bacterium]|nr:dTDP-4-dehydrorhamnose reductase [Melioribacteraceae bacterium]